MTPQELIADFRQQFPEIATATDAQHQDFYDSAFHTDLGVLWFESLAKVVNLRMGHGEHAKQLKDIFTYVAAKYRQEGEDIKNCIDACFLENLFWQVPTRRAAPVWDILPDVLKQLYLDFHKRPPS